MKKFYQIVIKLRIPIMIVFLVAAGFCAYCQQFIKVNYDMNDYLPEDSPSTVALDVMGEEFDGAIPNARVMIKDVDKKQALEYKEKLENIEGVSSVNWLDDTELLDMPLDMYDQDTLDTYYKDSSALFLVTIEEDYIDDAVPDIREVIGDDNAMTGAAVSTAIATESTVSEIQKIAVFGVLFTLFVLMITTTSWVEPFIVLIGLGIAILINAGSNLIFGEISFVTNAAGNILQLAVSLDYSVFLIHRFEECKEYYEPKEAMAQALTFSTTSILSSGLTTVIGFLALVLMRFKIGPDMGLALAKGIAVSLITVFLFMPGLILATYKWMDKTTHRDFLPQFRKFGHFICKVTVPLAILFVFLIVPTYKISNMNSYYYGSSHLFGKGTQFGDDTAEIQSVFGKSDNYVLMIPRGDMNKEKELSDALHDMDEVTSITSLADIIGTSIPTDIVPSSLLDQLQSENYDRMVISVAVDYEGDETFSLVEKIRNTAQEYYPDEYYLAGEGVSTYDLMDTITADMTNVNLVAIGAVFVVLLFALKSLILPVILVVVIETAIFINLSIPVMTGQTLFYIAYLIISSIQLGATVDYAILYTGRYIENRAGLSKKESIIETTSNCTASILTSGTVLTVVGFLLGIISTHGLLSQLGYLLGKGTMCSTICVLFVLPGFLYLFDGIFMRRKGGVKKHA